MVEQNLERGIALGGFAARPYVENNQIKIGWCGAEQFYPFALGGFAARPYVENNQIKIGWCGAEQFYPLKSNVSNVEECAIVSKTTQSGTENGQYIYYTLLEFHEWNADHSQYTYIYYTLLEFHQWNADHSQYTITNELYQSNNDSVVGVQVPLGTNGMYEGLQDQVIFSGITKPLFAYFKMPGTNNKVLDSPLGLGIIVNNEHTLKDIDYVHDALQWEIKTGKRTIAVPPESIEYDNLHRPTLNTDTDAFDVQLLYRQKVLNMIIYTAQL